MTTATAPAAPSLTAAGLPDVNLQTTPYAEVQRLLDQVAQLGLVAEPEVWGPEDEPTLTPEAPDDYFGIQGGYGMIVRSRLRSLGSRWSPRERRLEQTAGETAGSFRSRWLISPTPARWSVGEEPPPTLFDPWRPQSFSMLDCSLELGARGDGFDGYGVGGTFPVVVAGRPVTLVGGVGTATGGRGRMAGKEATFSLNGVLTPELGFEGNVTVRVPDPDGELISDSEVSVASGGLPGSGGAYLVLRGQKAAPDVRTEYGPPQGPGRVTLVTPAEMRTASFPSSSHGRRGLRTHPDVGEVVARLEARVELDILAPPGTVERPNPFTTRNVYTFLEDGRSIGEIEAHVTVGWSFALEFPSAPRQPAMRYGGFGPIVRGTGCFEGAQGLVSLNSAIGVAPHALSMINVLRLVESPGGPS